MKTNAASLFISITIIFLISASLSNCVPVKTEPLPGDPIAYFPKMVVGDSWVEKGYSSKYGTDVFNSKIIEVKSDGGFILETTCKRDKNKYHIYYNNKYQIIRDTNLITGEEEPISDPPPMRWNFPLFVGKTWSDSYAGTSISNTVHQYENTYNLNFALNI